MYVLTGQISIDLEVEAIGQAVTRDVTFVITDCAGTDETRTSPISFDAFGFASVLLTAVDADADWINVVEGHTLSRLAPLMFVSCAAAVDLTGVEALPAGDFNGGAAAPQDGIVDITDFSILASRWNTAIDPTLSIGADATANGFQGSDDFAAIQVNYNQVGDALNGCPLFAEEGDSRGGRPGRFPAVHYAQPLDARESAARIATDDLAIPNAHLADVNDDGFVDANDIREFARLHDLPLLPEFERMLQSIEDRPGRSLRR